MPTLREALAHHGIYEDDILDAELWSPSLTLRRERFRAGETPPRAMVTLIQENDAEVQITVVVRTP